MLYSCTHTATVGVKGLGMSDDSESVYNGNNADDYDNCRSLRCSYNAHCVWYTVVD